eukprot:1674144-Ditylum_brightwellii.AAC.1
MDANFQDMIEVYKEEHKTSQQQIEQLTAVMQQLVATNEKTSAFCRKIQSGVDTMKVNKSKNRREKDENKTETPKKFKTNQGLGLKKDTINSNGDSLVLPPNRSRPGHRSID